MTEQDNGTRAGRGWSRQALVIGGSALVAVLLAGLVVFAQSRIASCGGWFSGLTATTTRECVGMLSADQFDDDREVGGLVGRFAAANNDVVTSNNAYVKIVLLTPLTVRPDGKDSATSHAQIVSSLQGAFTAMTRANQPSSPYGSPNAPAIQVIPVNQGSQQADSDAVVSAVLGLNEPDHPVVAVVGLGSSLPGTTVTAQKLSDMGIPMVSAVASATGLNRGTVPKLRGISPSNQEYARALKEFLGRQTALKSGIIIADENDDFYVRSLRDAFAEVLGKYATIPEQHFHGGTVDSGAAASRVFNPVVANLCSGAIKLDTVFYAGRVADFRGFVAALDQRICKKERPLAILVGATGFDAARGYEQDIVKANLTVIYATSADSMAWTQPGYRATPAGFPNFLTAFHGSGFGDGSLGDGYAIMYHDAVATAAAATRLAVQDNNGDNNRVPGPGDVDTQLDNVTLTSAVAGASGTLSFPSGTDGRAMGKLVPLRQIGRTLGTPVLLPDHGCVYVVGGPCIPS